MLINKKLYFWFGLALVILVSIFTWSVVEEFRKNDEQIIQDLKYQNTISEARELIAKAQRDSARIEQMRMAFKLDEIVSHNLKQDNRITDVIKAFGLEEKERKNYIDEKDYIPNADTNKRVSYMSEYEYKEY